jgi:hypothetical protein
MAAARFRYTLDALLRKRRSDWKTLKQEEVQAGRVVDSRQVEAQRARGTVAQAERLLRAGRRDGATIDPARQLRLSGYLAQQRAALADRERALAQAREVRERIRANLEGVARGIMSLEKQRAAREADYRREQGYVEQRRADELWLLGRSSGSQQRLTGN